LNVAPAISFTAMLEIVRPSPEVLRRRDDAGELAQLGPRVGERRADASQASSVVFGRRRGEARAVSPTPTTYEEVAPAISVFYQTSGRM
jgi:hypothetical protein